MTKLELSRWRKAIWWAATEAYEAREGEMTTFLDLWHGALLDCEHRLTVLPKTELPYVVPWRDAVDFYWCPDCCSVLAVPVETFDVVVGG